MTVDSQIPRVNYVADGLNNTFSFAFTIIKNSDLHVFLDNVDQAEGIDYTIQNLTPAGGDVVFVVIPADLTQVLIERESDITQQVDYQPFTEFPADTHEFALDKITLILQELALIGGGIGQMVFSVFGRTGDVIAAANDYIASLIGFTPVGDITATDVQAAIAQVDASLDSFLGEAFATSLHDGGELNIVSGTDIEILVGDGLIIDSYTNPLEPPTRVHLSWPTNQFAIAAPAVAGTKVFFTVRDGNAAGPVPGTNLGVLIEYASEPSPDIIRDEILIGFAIHNGTAWKEITAPNTSNSVSHTLFEYIRSLTDAFIESDGEVTQAASFQLDQAAGVIWELSRNYINDVKDPNREAFAARTPMQWRYTNRDFSTVSALTSTVDPSQYDNGGVVGPIGGSSKTTAIQRLYMDQADNLWVLWGQNLHDNYAEAIGAIGADTTATDIPNTLDNSILLGHIIAERNIGDWTDEKAAFHSVLEGGGGGGGATSFVSLTDTPVDYIGHANKVNKVTSLEDGIGFSNVTIEDDGTLNNYLPAPGNNLQLSRAANAAGANIILRRARGTMGSEAPIILNDSLFVINARGYMDTDWSGNAVRIRGRATENWSDAANGSKLQFAVTQNGTIGAFFAMEIDHSGNVGINVTDPTDRLHVDGTVRFENLPTSNPGVSGALWNNGGVINIS